ncbi:hypothetical protein OsI_06032 [Oryza sativa Indica Group]|uniref:Uncharacterized protein n=1 Tax=Oryza sativa subsp. indica TaxID=39946 RepID=A2X1F2_ORYSI|nr:hypothetical protein OsI_06032 [Oryza sativa Indica Group]
MARFVDPLVVGRVIGEVVDLFVPSISMTAAYGDRDISNGCLVRPSAADYPPLVRISGRRNDLYTLIMTDPDAPSPSDPSMREFLHWIVVNIPGGTDASKGEEMVEYMGPRPTVGIHRYVLVLFEQKARFVDGALMPPADRPNFNTRAFAAYHQLGLPTAVVYFNSQREPANRRR